MDLDKKTVLFMTMVVAAVFVLASIFLLPKTVNVIVEGGGPVTTTIPGVYTILDCTIIAIAAFLLGTSGVFLSQVAVRTPVPGAVISPPIAEPLPEIQTGFQNPGEDHRAEPLRKNTPEGSDNFLNLLKGSERGVMEALTKYGEMNQADLSARTGIPKSTLSRTLQNLEDRKLVFRYDNGMSKMVKPEIHWQGSGENNHH